MKKHKINIYYNEDSGFLIVPYAALEKTIAKVAIEPVTKLKNTVSSQELGEKTLLAMKLAQESKPINKSDIDKNVLAKASGIKSFPKFSNNYRNISVINVEDEYLISEWIRKQDGSYAPPENKNEIKSLANVTDEELGQCILSLLKTDSLAISDTAQAFKTFNGHIIKYKSPSDEFIDIGDGGVDAYQIFEHNEGICHFAFLYENKYAAIDKQSIGQRWEEMYGNLKDFKFEKTTIGIFEFSAKASTDDKIIYSNFFQEDNIWSEFFMQINKKDLSENQIQDIIGEYESIAKSCIFEKIYTA